VWLKRRSRTWRSRNMGRRIRGRADHGEAASGVQSPVGFAAAHVSALAFQLPVCASMGLHFTCVFPTARAGRPAGNGPRETTPRLLVNVVEELTLQASALSPRTR
jgi:hypothetical protein